MQVKQAWDYWPVKKDFAIWIVSFVSTWVFGISFGN